MTYDQALFAIGEIGARFDLGARISTESTSSRTRDEHWTLRYRNSIAGPKLVKARRKGQRTLAWAQIPSYVREYAEMTDNWRCNISWAELPENADSDDIVKARKRAMEATYHVIIKHVVSSKPVLGIRLFGEVGDSGSGPGDFLPLRCLSMKRLRQCAAQLQSYVRDLEIETGWAEVEEG